MRNIHILTLGLLLANATCSNAMKRLTKTRSAGTTSVLAVNLAYKRHYSDNPLFHSNLLLLQQQILQDGNLIVEVNHIGEGDIHIKTVADSKIHPGCAKIRGQEHYYYTHHPYQTVYTLQLRDLYNQKDEESDQ